MLKHTKKQYGCLPWLIAVCILLAAAPIFWWYENQTIQIEEITVSSRSLPENFSGFRVAMVADLHGMEFGKDNWRLIETVRKTCPDIIAINGDLIEDAEQIQMVGPLIGRLLEIAPVFYVTGNHEWYANNVYELMSLLEEKGVIVLANKYKTLEIDGQSIVVAGVHDPNGPYDMKTPEELVTEIRAAQGEDTYVLMLTHRNNQISLWSSLGVDTVLAGHGHGGIIRLPFIGGLVDTTRTLFPEYTDGLYTQGKTNMVVSRGLGNSGVNFRLFNRPQVPVVILENES